MIVTLDLRALYGFGLAPPLPRAPSTEKFFFFFFFFCVHRGRLLPRMPLQPFLGHKANAKLLFVFLSSLSRGCLGSNTISSVHPSAGQELDSRWFFLEVTPRYRDP